MLVRRALSGFVRSCYSWSRGEKHLGCFGGSARVWGAEVTVTCPGATTPSLAALLQRFHPLRRIWKFCKWSGKMGISPAKGCELRSRGYLSTSDRQKCEDFPLSNSFPGKQLILTRFRAGIQPCSGLIHSLHFQCQFVTNSDHRQLTLKWFSLVFCVLGKAGRTPVYSGRSWRWQKVVV